MEEIENKKLKRKEILFPFGYQRRSNEDLFKFFIIENRKSLRGFHRLLFISLISILIGLFTKSTIALIIMFLVIIFLLVTIVGYFNIWRGIKKWERGQILSRVVVKNRILNYGDFGIVYQEESKNGWSQEKYVWNRYGYIIEWENWLFLIPAKKKADIFEINQDEIGKENFLAFRDFTKSKLKYQMIKNFTEII